jgi:small-conductance mechanosensitive channel
LSSDDLTTATIVSALAFLAGGLLVGLAGRHLITRYLKRTSSEDPAQAGTLAVAGLPKLVLAWSTIAGAYGASVVLPLKPALEEVVEQALLAAAILGGTLALARVTGAFASFYASRNSRLPHATSIFANLARFGVLALGVLVTLQTLGVSVAPLLTALGVGGLAVALALQDTLSNLFAGLHVIASGEIRPGDYVLLDSGEQGYVQDINWRNTSLRSLSNNTVVVPNARIASSILTNYYQPAEEMSLIIPVGVSYDCDLGRVETVTKEVGRQVLRTVKGGVPDYEPLIRFHTFGDSAIGLDVILRVKEHSDQYLIKHEFVKRLHNRYREAGIEIPYPIQTVFNKFDYDLDEASVGSDGRR